MSEMFKDCIDLDTVDISNMGAKDHLNMESMFENCDSLDNVFMENFTVAEYCSCNFENIFEGIDDLEQIVFSIDNSKLPNEFLNLLLESEISVVGNQQYTGPEDEWHHDWDNRENDMDEYSNDGNNDEFIDDNGNDEGVDLLQTVNNTINENNNEDEPKTTIKKKKISIKGIIGIVVALIIGIVAIFYTFDAFNRCREEGEYNIPISYNDSL